MSVATAVRMVPQGEKHTHIKQITHSGAAGGEAHTHTLTHTHTHIYTYTHTLTYTHIRKLHTQWCHRERRHKLTRTNTHTKENKLRTHTPCVVVVGGNSSQDGAIGG